MLLLSSVVAFAPARASAQTSTPVCVIERGREPVLAPVDQGERVRSFAAFRARLRAIVRTRDQRALLEVVDPSVRIAFDDSGGIDDFRAYVRAEGNRFWDEFGRVLSLGGTFIQPDVFAAPYVYSNWPEPLDSFACLAVTGTSVRLRARPSTSARVIRTLDYAIVESVTPQPGLRGSNGWQRVLTADGRSGYVAEAYLRSPVDHRALFQRENGVWRLVAFVAGD